MPGPRFPLRTELSPSPATADPSKIRGPFSNGNMRGYQTLIRLPAAAAPADNGAGIGIGMPQFDPM
jgi:hypothetical protein